MGRRIKLEPGPALASLNGWSVYEKPEYSTSRTWYHFVIVDERKGWKQRDGEFLKRSRKRKFYGSHSVMRLSHGRDMQRLRELYPDVHEWLAAVLEVNPD
jgi:hypothetical protein